MISIWDDFFTYQIIFFQHSVTGLFRISVWLQWQTSPQSGFYLIFFSHLKVWVGTWWQVWWLHNHLGSKVLLFYCSAVINKWLPFFSVQGGCPNSSHYIFITASGAGETSCRAHSFLLKELSRSWTCHLHSHSIDQTLMIWPCLAAWELGKRRL